MLWWSTSSFGLGLGLGELRIDSTLATPFRASIELRGLDQVELDPERITVTIESGANTGIEYRLERTGTDTARLLLFSRATITEPLFEFSVEVNWDRNTVIRSYDVLLDPPVYLPVPSPRAVVAAAEVTEDAQGHPAEQVEALPEPAVDNGLAVVAQAPAKPDDDESTTVAIDPAIREWLRSQRQAAGPQAIVQRREYGPTIDGNSIWRVARAVATDSPELNIYQWMYGIWKANPDAFYRSNMHRLNMGEVLSIPLEREIAETSRRQAWRAYNEQMALLEAATAIESPGDEREQIAQVDDGYAATQTEATIDEAPSGDGAGGKIIEVRDTAEAAPAESDPEPSEVSSAGFSVADISGENPRGGVIELPGEIAQPPDESAVPVSPANSEAESLAQSAAIPDPLEPVESGTAGEIDVTPPSTPQVTAQPETETPATVAAGSEESVSADGDAVVPGSRWRNSLVERQQRVARLPVIGEQAPLAALGRFVQRVDEFVATSPSWAAMAFGGWLMLVMLALAKEMRMRRQSEAVRPRVADRPQPRSSPAPVMAPVPASAAARQPHSPEPGAAARLPQEIALIKARRDDQGDGNANEILEKADGFMQANNPGEAIKLLRLALKLQPDRIVFVLRLLEIYHKLKRADDFEFLLQGFRPALVQLKRDDRLHLQSMYARLCPRGTPLIDPQQPDEQDGPGDVTAAPLANEQDMLEEQLESGLDMVVGAGSEEAEYESTQVIMMNNGRPLDEEAGSAGGMIGEVLDLEVTLSEVDVYLAYGLYDNAEELLLKGLEVDPNRVDFLAKLLDTYYATQNLVDFVTCAEALREMGEEANRLYWDKVEVMGYELAPYNELFSGGKDRSLEGIELEIAKPEAADFDLASEANDARLAVGGVAQADVKSGTGAIDTDLGAELELELDMSELADSSLDDDGALSLDDSQTSEENLVDEILAQEPGGDPAIPGLGEDDTDLTFGDDKVLGLNAGDDDELHKLAGNAAHPEIDDDDEVLDLDGSLDTTGFEFDKKEASTPDADSIGIADVEFDDDELLDLDGTDDHGRDNHDGEEQSMKFTIPEQDERTDDNKAALALDAPEQPRATPVLKAVEESSMGSGDGRILFFPDNTNAGDSSVEFESEVKITLQALRDQLQYMTERLYRQERGTADLRQALTDLREHDGRPGRKDGKKSS